MNDIIEKIWNAIALFPFLTETFMRGINMNTELLAKIHHALQSPFIGDIIFSDDEIKEMREDCKKSYRNMQGKYGATLSMAEVDKLVVLIINIAKQWVDESEGRFWVKLYNEIFEDVIMFYLDLKKEKECSEKLSCFMRSLLKHPVIPLYDYCGDGTAIMKF